MHPPTLIPRLDWEPNGDESDPEARFLATADVCGLSMHFEAIAVNCVGNPLPASCFSPEDFDAIFCAVGGDKGWQTTTVNGREYIIIATPFCR